MTERRHLLQALAVLTALPLAGGTRGQTNDPRIVTVDELRLQIAPDAQVVSEGIRLNIPSLADNGHVVPVRVTVDSPMSADDHIRRILLLSTRNPVSRIASFTLGPWSGRAELATRVRLAGTQTVVALAEPSSGPWRIATAEVIVTESACLDLG